MKVFLLSGCLVVFLAGSMTAQPSVVQMATAKTSDCSSPCNSLTVSFAPSTPGNTLVAVFDETINFFVEIFISCTDNFGQEWTPGELNQFQSAIFFFPPQNPSGVSSLQCKKTTAQSIVGFSIIVFELKGVDQHNPTLFQCSGNTGSLLRPGISLFQADTLDVTAPLGPDIITASSPGLTSAVNLIQTLGDPPLRVATMDSFYQITSDPTQPPTFSSLQSGSSPSCNGITFSPPHIVDPYPDLMNGFNIVAATGVSADLLATLGRPINGIAADGVTQILVRIPAANVGDEFVFSMLDANNRPSVHPFEDGTLGNPGEASPNIVQSQIVTFAVSTASGPFAFAVYRAPLDFNRGGGLDDNASSRTISIEVLGEAGLALYPINCAAACSNDSRALEQLANLE